MNKEKARERNELINRMHEMSFPELVELESCNYDCPAWKIDGCGCCQCFVNGGYFKPGELENRVEEGIITESEKEYILETIKNGGALGRDGCILKRKFRSRDCLEYLCNPFRTVSM